MKNVSSSIKMIWSHSTKLSNDKKKDRKQKIL